MRLRYYIVNKPFGVLSQFTNSGRHQTLKELGPFPNDVYAAGRLDADSEGLLLLTNDKELTHVLTDPRYGHPRTYLVQVEGCPTGGALERLRRGVVVEGKRTRLAVVRLLEAEPAIPPRVVPIRFRKSVPTSWLEMTLREGRNRQVRKMTAAVGYPTLRLVRTRIGALSINGLAPAESRELLPHEIQDLKNV